VYPKRSLTAKVDTVTQLLVGQPWQDKPGHPFYAKEKALYANIRNSWKIWLSRLSL